MDVKELRFSVDLQNEDYGLSDQDTADVIKDKEQDKINDDAAGYVNKGFNDSCSSREELSSKVEVKPNHTSKRSTMSAEVPVSPSPDGYVNTAFEDGPQKADKVNDKNNGTVPRAHDTTVITSATLENQITKLDEDNNGVVAVNLETKEKKWKVQSVGWDTRRSVILFGLVLAFDAWAALFYCFKTNIVTNVFNI